MTFEVGFGFSVMGSLKANIEPNEPKGFGVLVINFGFVIPLTVKKAVLLKVSCV